MANLAGNSSLKLKIIVKLVFEVSKCCNSYYLCLIYIEFEPKVEDAIPFIENFLKEERKTVEI